MPDAINASSRAAAAALAELDLIDRALYAAVAGTDTPNLDRAMRGLSHAADYSKLSITAAAALACCCGVRGRRAALCGLSSVVTTATVVNLVVKPLSRRRRPDRTAGEVPVDRHVRMPGSRSFPSGHTAAAVAFAGGVGRVLPAAGIPLHALAALVGYSRVHTGVHYPGDVIGGALLGAMLSDATVGWVGRKLPLD